MQRKNTAIGDGVADHTHDRDAELRMQCLHLAASKSSGFGIEPAETTLQRAEAFENYVRTGKASVATKESA